MASDKSNIGQLYKDTFIGYEVHESGGEWIAIESKLSYLNFMHFGLFNFNIYYALLIAGSVVLNIILGINYFSAKQNDNMNNLIPADSTLILNKDDSSSNDNPTVQNIDSENVITKKQVNTDLNTREKQPIDKNEHLKEKNTFQKNLSSDVVNVSKKSGRIKPEPENNKLVIDSLPVKSEKMTDADTITNLGMPDSVSDDLSIPEQLEKKTIIIKPQDVIERDTVIIYKKRKK
ncbi:MAG: hypothetical protein K8R68_12525 [Bacteroidales bacterium]|nr:hypothetical protein [Bacteroidales bacterium]